MPLKPSATTWATGPEATVPYSTEPWFVQAHVKDGAGHDGYAGVAVRTQDVTAPTVSITGDHAVSVAGQGATNLGVLPRLEGRARDSQSGVKTVEWRLNGGGWQTVPAQNRSGSKWWVTDISLGTPGLYRIEVRATDRADERIAGVPANITPPPAYASLAITVTEQYRPKDPTVHEYYTSLVDFVVKRMRLNGSAVTQASLEQFLMQPFGALLATSPSEPGPPVAQLRICLEVLRKHIDAVLKAAEGSADPALWLKVKQLRLGTERGYATAAYDAILRRLGTSAEELTIAVESGDPTRLADVAERLGVELASRKSGGPQPGNTLTPFLLTGDRLAEPELEKLFGLVSFQRDPLASPGADPYLLTLQLHRLLGQFRAQDATVPEPILDPDVLTQADLRPGANPAGPLLEARRLWLDGLLGDLRDGRVTVPVPAPEPTPQPLPQDELTAAEGGVFGGASRAAADPLARFDLILETRIAPVQVLQRIERTHASGESVAAELENWQLSFAAFDRVMRLRELAVNKAITDPGWEDLFAIVIGVQKARIRQEWQQAERGLGIHVGPAYFAVTEPQGPGSQPSSWRVDPRARRRFLTRLQGRIEQEQTARQAFAAAIAGAEEDALPGLRDGLMFALNLLGSADSSALADRLLLDVMTDGSARLTRIDHAIQTLQTLILAVRTGTAPGWSRAIASQPEADFDEELRWIGSYANWHAAMQVFLYPENHLHPTLRPPDEWSTDFGDLVRRLRSSRPLTPEAAADIASDEFGITLERTRPVLLNRAGKQRSFVTGLGTTDLARLKALPVGFRETYYFVPMTIAIELHRSGQYLAALDWFRMVYAYDLPVSQRKIHVPLDLERSHHPPGHQLMYERNILWLAETLNPHDIVDESYPDTTSTDPSTARYDVHTRFVVHSIVRCLLDFAESEFVQDTNESLPRARALYLEALDLLALPELNPAKVDQLTPNEVTTSLRWRAQSALAKLRTGRNFAGLTRQVETGAPAGSSGLLVPLAAGSGPFGSGSLRAFQPTPYRFGTLIERAKQLAGVAQQIEQSYLSAIEKYDAERYALFKAQQDMALAHSQVTLQDLRAREAADGVALAELQQDRAAFQIAEYQKLLDQPMNQWERELLDDYGDALEARNWIAGMDAAITISQAVSSIGNLGEQIFSFGASAAANTAVIAAAAAKFGFAVDLNNIETDIQRHSLHASVENRVREWTLQQGLARQDKGISDQQRQLALDQQAIVAQEGVIAQLQLAQAESTIAFLNGKFTNVELYDWMIGVLQGVYGYFLRQATSVAQLAQAQLTFEIQEQVPAMIRRDYWQPSDDNSPTAPADRNRDRAGLTGSARLLQDVYQLDQFAFDNGKRKLQLTKTFSLAQLAPLEFQQFRRTGVMSFATPNRLFDEEFPGHYLRLIKRVRTSVVALVPPQRGIRATLSNQGVSRAVVGGTSFQSVRLSREPESVALTSPAGSTGVFELDAQPELLLPFELSGVDSLWTLEMPKAANPFDFRTVADVLVTFEYTALASADYRATVIGQLDRTTSAVRAYSVRDELPDQWYDLHNPSGSDAALEVGIEVLGKHFPVNLDEITTTQLALYVVAADRAGGASPIGPIKVELRFAPADGSPEVAGPATSSAGGIVSTRIGNAASWLPMLDRSPVGTWRLRFADPEAIRPLLKEDAIADIALVISHTGRLPEWPL
ncbi:MAG: neuraminidase-like domain-containing protein [Nocardioides sp.]